MRTRPSDPLRLDNVSLASQLLYRGINRVPCLHVAGRYNVTISHESKFIWFRVAKAGTRTILNHFKGHDVCLDAEHASDVYYSPGLYSNYFKFAFVRNPWDRLVSCWFDKVVNTNLYRFNDIERIRMREFDNFIDYVAGLNLRECDRHLRLQCALIDLNNIDYVGRMEAFEVDFRNVCNKLDVPVGDVEAKNVSDGRGRYHGYYDQALRDKVLEIYAKDIRIFGYHF